MKITETEKGNVKLVLSKADARALSELLDNFPIKVIHMCTSNAEVLQDMWEMLDDSRYMLCE